MSKYSDIFSKHNIVPISESGINNSDDLKTLNSIGIKGGFNWRKVYEGK